MSEGTTPAVDERKLGKLAPVFSPKRINIEELQRFGLQAPRYWRVDWRKKVDAARLGMLLNNRLGCCTWSSKGHQVQTWTAWTGQQATIPDEAIERNYSASSGYVPGQPATDKGDTIEHVLEWWKAHDLAGHKVDGWCYASGVSGMRTAIWLFGGVDIGLMLPRTCKGQDVWRYVTNQGDGAPGTWGGHDVNVIDYDDSQQLFICITWGGYKAMSYPFFAAYCDEARGLASRDWLQVNEATPSDLNWDEVMQWINQGT
jgi:hypothetical protein